MWINGATIGCTPSCSRLLLPNLLFAFTAGVQGIALSGHIQRESGAAGAGGDLMREQDDSAGLANLVFADDGERGSLAFFYMFGAGCLLAALRTPEIVQVTWYV